MNLQIYTQLKGGDILHLHKLSKEDHDECLKDNIDEERKNRFLRTILKYSVYKQFLKSCRLMLLLRLNSITYAYNIFGNWHVLYNIQDSTYKVFNFDPIFCS